MDDFNFVRASSVADASKRAAAATEAKYLAGGQTLLPVMKQRLASPSDLISLSRIPELSAISCDDDKIVIGATARHADVAAHPGINALLPALAVLAGGIGDPHVRNRGTIGGSLANNDPAADYPAAALGLGATIETDKRHIAADDYFQGLFSTALDAGELITRVVFPIPRRAGYIKFPHAASRYALVGVMVSQSATGVRVAVTGAGAGVFRVPAMEMALARSFSAASIEASTVPPTDLTSDIHGSAEYRAHLITIMARRAVARALGESLS